MEEKKQFKDLKVSTMTIMVYTNMEFDIEKLFKELPITEIDVPLTKKKKTPNLKKITAPYNSIISIRYKNDFRGVETKKKPTDGKKNHFLNQISCIISLGDKLLHIMIFRCSKGGGKFKIAGAKNFDQATLGVQLLWGHIKSVPDSFTMRDKHPPIFVFDVAMINVDFKLGFTIDRKKLNNLMNRPEYRDKVHLSRFETTSNTNVNIKMHSEKPQKYLYTYMILREGKPPKFIKSSELRYNTQTNKEKKKNTTFLVFRSSKVIESGKYSESMTSSYNYFIDIIEKNRDAIAEKIVTNNEKYQHRKS